MGKTVNYSVRFDEEKLAFFKERNPTIKKPQQIVNFFLDEFYWKHTIGNTPTYVNTDEVKSQVVQVADTPKIDEYTESKDETGNVDNSSIIAQYEQELTTLPDKGQIANARRKWLMAKIEQLKYNQV